MEAPAKKWFPKWEPKVTQNGPLPGRPDERKHNETKDWIGLSPFLLPSALPLEKRICCRYVTDPPTRSLLWWGSRVKRETKFFPKKVSFKKFFKNQPKRKGWHRSPDRLKHLDVALSSCYVKRWMAPQSKCPALLSETCNWRNQEVLSRLGE